VEDTEHAKLPCLSIFMSACSGNAILFAIQKKDPAAGRFAAAEFSLRNISCQVVWQRVC
jgi:hypothetical protein